MFKISITIKSFEWYYIEKTSFIINTMQFLLNKKNPKAFKLLLKNFSLPSKRKLFTVLRSPHIDKKSREQFEFQHFKKTFIIENKNSSIIHLLFFLLKNSYFPGIEIEISLFYSSCLNIID